MTWDGTPTSSTTTTVVVAGVRFMWGSGTISVTASSTGSTSPTFSPAFASAPKVMVDGDNWNYNVQFGSVTTSGFQAAARHVDGTSGTATVNVNWMAIGPA